MILRKRHFHILMFSMSISFQSPCEEFIAPNHGMVGSGIVFTPKYLGSTQNDTHVVPLFHYRLGQSFIDSRETLYIGHYFFENKGITIAGLISPALHDSRQSSDDSLLNSDFDIEATTQAGVKMNITNGILATSAALFSDVGSNHQGTTLTVETKVHFYPKPQLLLSFGPSATWGSKNYMQTFFGVNRNQSESSIFRNYDIDSGISSFSFSVDSNYSITKNIGISANISNSFFMGRVKNSPIVNDNNHVNSELFIIFRF